MEKHDQSIFLQKELITLLDALKKNKDVPIENSHCSHADFQEKVESLASLLRYVLLQCQDPNSSFTLQDVIQKALMVPKECSHCGSSDARSLHDHMLFSDSAVSRVQRMIKELIDAKLIHLVQDKREANALEFGDLFLDLILQAHIKNINVEEALHHTCNQVRRRLIEEQALQKSRDLQDEAKVSN